MTVQQNLERAGERRRRRRADRAREWRAFGGSVTLPRRITQLCLSVTTPGEGGEDAIPGLMLSQDGIEWSRVRPLGRLKLADGAYDYFVPRTRDVERISAAAPVKVRVALFTAVVDTDIKTGITLYGQLADGGVSADPYWSGDHGDKTCEELSRDIQQHQDLLVELEARCSGGGSGEAEVENPFEEPGDDMPEPTVDIDWCFMRDVTKEDLADAQKVYLEKGCGQVSV